jgi:hypothetical protein
MRKLSLSFTLLASLGLSSLALAGGPEDYGGQTMMGGDECCECDPCACGGGQGQRRNRYAEAGFNCGCNGSYKYPVPPLYTYHWPGMYSANLMTDYHSPWRFPPLKPYTDEAPVEVQSSIKSLRRVQPAAAIVEKRVSGGRSSFADQVERSLR